VKLELLEMATYKNIRLWYNHQMLAKYKNITKMC